jgi:FkbM family methyltransferase
MLQRNKSINHLDNLNSINKGLWSKNNSRLKIVGEDAYSHIIELSETDTINESDEIIYSTTINDYCKDNNIAAIDLIMLDIEGGEFMALKGANNVLAMEHAPVVVFEIHNNYVDWSNGLENAEIIQYISSFGYTSFAIRDFHSNFNIGNHPIELIPVSDVYLEGPPHGFNMLAVKDLKSIDNNNFKICKNVSPKLLWSKNSQLHHPLNWVG